MSDRERERERKKKKEKKERERERERDSIHITNNKAVIIWFTLIAPKHGRI